MASVYTGIERRSSKRLRMNCTVVYRVNEPPSASFVMQGQDLDAKMIDISRGGMGMITSQDIPVSTLLSMRFTMLNVNNDAVTFSGPMEAKGEVKSNIPLEKEGHRLGIYFTEMKRINVG